MVSVQNQYNIAHRGADDVIEFCERRSIGFIPWFPLASGKLARPGGPVDRVAQQLGATASQVCLAWLLRRSPVMLPIPGTSSVDHLEENCAAAALSLSDAAVRGVGRRPQVPPPLGADRLMEYRR